MRITILVSLEYLATMMIRIATSRMASLLIIVSVLLMMADIPIIEAAEATEDGGGFIAKNLDHLFVGPDQEPSPESGITTKAFTYVDREGDTVPTDTINPIPLVTANPTVSSATNTNELDIISDVGITVGDSGNGSSSASGGTQGTSSGSNGPATNSPPPTQSPPPQPPQPPQPDSIGTDVVGVDNSGGLPPPPTPQPAATTTTTSSATQLLDINTPCPRGYLCSIYGEKKCDDVRQIPISMGLGDIHAGIYCPGRKDRREIGYEICSVGQYCPNSTAEVPCPEGFFCPHKVYVQYIP